jgi:hypothetical protein
MIKKLLLAIIPCMLALALHAQNGRSESVMLKAYKADKCIPFFKEPQRDFSLSNHFTGRKGTATGGSRWYIPFQMTDATYLGNVLTNTGNAFLYYMDWDSTLYQQYRDPVTQQLSYGPVNWVGIGQFVDPIWSIGFTTLVDQYSTTDDIVVLGSYPYSVDSIAFRGAYMQPKIGGRPHVVDTLYCSIAPVPYDSFETFTAADTVFHGKVVNYDGVSAHNGEMKILTLWDTDTATRQLTYPGTISWKVALDSSTRDSMTASGTFPTKTFVLPVNNGLSSLNVPASMGYAITVAYKPGGGWTYKDSVASHDYFMFYASEAAAGQRMPYYYYDYKDRNVSFLEHYAALNRYGSSYRLEMRNTDNFSEEFIWLGGHVTCAQCWDLSVAKGNNNLLTAKAYPNPANEMLNIPFTLVSATHVQVTLMNAVGQVVAKQTVSGVTNGKASFNTTQLNSGIYFYTVEAGGERKTGSVTVAH